MAHTPKGAAAPSTPDTSTTTLCLRAQDALEDIANGLQAFDALVQLTYPTKTRDSIDLCLVNREDLAYLLQTINTQLRQQFDSACLALNTLRDNLKPCI